MDIISCLPDELICHILSFLPTVESVQTSVLSKRWNFLWTHVSFLEFDLNGKDRFEYYAKVYGIDWLVNSRIITKILFQHKHDMLTFHYINTQSYDGDIDGSGEEFESWIVNITSRKIRNLVVHLCNQFALPKCLFTCETLVDLFLSGCGGIPTSGIYFPALKKLKLDCVGFEYDESLVHLISSCPVLEELSIEGRMSGHCCVSSPTITRLALKLYRNYIMNFEVKLDTPALRYIQLEIWGEVRYSVGALDSLIEADITFYGPKSDQDNFIRSLLAIVGKLCNVQLLTFSMNRTVMIHDSAFSALGIKFPNLTKLDLSTNMSFITNFLENANNLRVLELTRIVVDFDNQYRWMGPKRVPACLISHLQNVVCHFRCYKHQFDILRYILMNGKALKRVEIRTKLGKCDWKKKFKVLKKLASFGRGSQECRLVFD